VRDIARTGIRPFDVDMPLDHALDLLERGPMPVRSETGEILGVLSRSALMRTWRRRLERES